MTSYIKDLLKILEVIGSTCSAGVFPVIEKLTRSKKKKVKEAAVICIAIIQWRNGTFNLEELYKLPPTGQWLIRIRMNQSES